jgi:hypothetical protein
MAKEVDFIFSNGWLAGIVLGATGFGSVSAGAQTPQTPQQLVQAMLAYEQSPHTDHYEFVLNERSDRTGGHLWTEHVVETGVGRVRLLVAEDGKPLSPERAAAERAKLDEIAAHPEEFARREQAQKDDEAHARQMLAELPKGFLLENVRLADGVWRIDFRPNPEYSPSGFEEKVLHAMSGWIAIDARDLRMTHIEGHLPQDFSIGYGLLANIKAGSFFMNDRALVAGHWRTVHVETDVRGKAALFKSVARKSYVTRSEFVYLDPKITVPEAVALVEK